MQSVISSHLDFNDFFKGGLRVEKSSGLSNNIVVVVGLSFLLIALLLVLVKMYKNYQRVMTYTAEHRHIYLTNFTGGIATIHYF